MAIRLQSGGSSHGQPRYYAMVKNSEPDKLPILIEIKQEQPAPLAGWDDIHYKCAALESAKNWTGDLSKADSTQIVRGQTSMGGNSNHLTGCTMIDGISYLVREREHSTPLPARSDRITLYARYPAGFQE